MNTFLIYLLTIIYVIVSVAILCATMAYPIVILFDKNMHWLAWILYPTTAIIVITHKKVIKNLD